MHVPKLSPIPILCIQSAQTRRSIVFNNTFAKFCFPEVTPTTERKIYNRRKNTSGHSLNFIQVRKSYLTFVYIREGKPDG